MKLRAFRITNFRSIVDSGWVPFSQDGITVLVGQNESGKSSVLEALYYALTIEAPSRDDFRIDAAAPKVFLRVSSTVEEARASGLSLTPMQLGCLCDLLDSNNNLVDVECGWTDKPGLPLEPNVTISSAKLEELVAEALAREEAIETLAVASAAMKASVEALANGTLPAPVPAPVPALDKVASPNHVAEIGYEVWRALPLGVLFNEEAGQLPNHVDIDADAQPVGLGAKAAQNFLNVAGVDLSQLLRGDRRARETILNRANAKVSEDFNSFWSQTIGKSGKLALRCDFDHYPASDAAKAGRPHLVFWVCDGSTQLYPKQRSQGVRWFVSFYLQLKASERAKSKRIFLLDEPGSNLHAKAQRDVLRLINDLGKDTASVVYSTHSPQMLEYTKLFRVHAVQRDGDLEDSPTRIIDAHRLGSASTDTLSPVLMAMGADMAQHDVIQKSNNVLLEEMSGHYYLTSFWKLLGIQKKAHFIAATGVNKIEALANMFRGWGLEFIVAVDDDKQGREALKSIRREMFGDDEAHAAKYLAKFRGFTSIEDVFSKSDFSKFVLGDPTATITGTNGEYLKANGRSKPVLAFQFSLAVERGEVVQASLDADTLANVTAILKELTDRLP